MEPEKVSAFVNWLEEKDFYDVMQAYRHAPIADQSATVAAFENVKKFIRHRAAYAQSAAPTQPDLGSQIEHMVNRFLGWRLPENFNPDGGISFKKAINEDRPSWPQKNEPTGTNLFDYGQAEEMVHYMLVGLGESTAPPAERPQMCVMCQTGKSNDGQAVLECAWVHIRGEYSWRHPLVADRMMSIACDCPGFIVWTHSLKDGRSSLSLAHAFSAGIAWQAKTDRKVSPAERPAATHGAYDEYRRKLKAIIRWLEANQSDVFKRGLWEAIDGAESEPEAQPLPKQSLICMYCGEEIRYSAPFFISGPDTAMCAWCPDQKHQHEPAKPLPAVPQATKCETCEKWMHEFNMYRSAWLREIGGTIHHKTHEIDGFVLRTREIYEQSKKWLVHEKEVSLRLRDPFWMVPAESEREAQPMPECSHGKMMIEPCEPCGRAPVDVDGEALVAMREAQPLPSRALLCPHDRLDEEGYCHTCGSDMRSGIDLTPALPQPRTVTEMLEWWRRSCLRWPLSEVDLMDILLEFSKDHPEVK